MSRSPRHEVVVVRGEGGRIVCERCEVADTVIARARGLLGRKNLPSGAGLLIRPGFSIHTLFMRFPIDAVFLDGERRVVRIAADVRPWRTAAARRSRAVLELAAGEAARVGIEPGHLLRLEVEG
jgi:uncharacterized membrane protein (UPF0127 family)